jgi:hypothetical protein
VGSDTGAGVNKGYVDTNFVNRSTAQTGIAGAKTFTGAITLSSGLTVDTNTLVVDATNDRVGIGTASPGYKLSVSSTSGLSGFASDGTVQQAFAYPATSLAYAGTVNNYPYALIVNNLERMRIDTSGNLILGNVTSAGDTTRNLDIYNSSNGASAASIVRLITNNTSGNASSIGQIVKYQNSGAFAIQNTDVGATAHIRLDVGNTERMRIDSAGSVGIGTNNPDVKLHVVGPGGVQAKLQATNVTQSMGYIGAGDDIAYAGTLSNHPYAFITNNVQRVIVGTGGNVGIGTGSPSTKLEVVTTGTGTNGINIRNSDTGAYGSLHIQGTSGGVASWANGFVMEGVPYSTGNTILSSYTGALKFQTGTSRTERMGISSTGVVTMPANISASSTTTGT